MQVKLKIIAISFALLGGVFLSGCHTAEGFGQDVSAGGRGIQNAASSY